jgi:hypothetical protein
VKALERSFNWQLVSSDDEQKLFVDIRTPRGRELFDGLFDGRTVCRNEFSKNLVLADVLLRNEKTAEQGFEFALKAFQSNPSRASIVTILAAIRFPFLKDKVFNCCKSYFDDFENNKNTYIKQSGYYYRLIAALYSAIYLQDMAQMQHNIALARFYQEKRAEYTDGINDLFARIVW